MATNLRLRRALGASAAAAAVSALLLAGTVAPAAADHRGHGHRGGVQNLALSATKPDHAYRVHASWTAVYRATKYVVTMTTASGAQLDKGTVTTPEFTGTTTLPAGSLVKMTVLPNASKWHHAKTSWRRAATQWIKLPDLTAPLATYTVTPASSSSGMVTIHLMSLTDDLSPASAITQHVSWGGSTSLVSASGLVTSFVHSYGPTKAVHHPVVTVSDAAGNSSTYALTAVVADVLAPSGTFSVSPATAWAKWTKVTLTQTALADDLSPAEAITRLVTWGDGHQQAWPAGTALSHRYDGAGTFAPAVSVADEAGNTAALATSTVTVTVDSIAPRVRVKLPTYAKHSVRRWSTLKGRATDTGTGVRAVRVRAIEKRGAVWYAYRPARQTWVRAGATRQAAWNKARVARIVPGTTPVWSLRLHHLKKGVLITKVSGRDNVRNVSAWTSYRAALTRR